MPGTIVETNCTIEHEGRVFESGGAYVSDDYIVAYLGKDSALTSWHGAHIGKYHLTARWERFSYLSRYCYQVYALVNGKVYTGRSAGCGMVVKLKSTKRASLPSAAWFHNDEVNRA